jgi:transposase
MPPAEVLYAKVLSLEAEVADLQARVSWFQRQMFAGSRSEKLPIESAAQTKLGLAEVPQSQQAAKTQTVSYERRAPAPEKRPQPAEVFAQLPVHEIVEIIPDEVTAEPGAFEKISEERNFEVEIIGPKLVKREFVRPKFRRKAARDTAPVIAPAVPRPAAGGYASAGLIAYVVISKYQHHLPLYAGPGIKGAMPGDGLCRVGAGGASTAVAQDPA